jgi:hypothetical protein
VRGDATRACSAGNDRVRSPGDNAVPSQPEGSNHRQRAWPLWGTTSEPPVEGSLAKRGETGCYASIGDGAAAGLRLRRRTDRSAPGPEAAPKAVGHAYGQRNVSCQVFFSEMARILFRFDHEKFACLVSVLGRGLGWPDLRCVGYTSLPDTSFASHCAEHTALFYRECSAQCDAKRGLLARFCGVLPDRALLQGWGVHAS